MLAAVKSNDPLAARRQELQILDIAIRERKQYLRDQEALITELVEQGNSELMSLTHDILFAKQHLRDLKTDIRTTAQDKVLLNNDFQRLQQQVGVYVPTGILRLQVFC